MSRIRIVGGSITKTTGGDHNIYSEGNIVYTSGEAITETSDAGIVYGEYKDPEKKEEECVKEIELLTALDFGSTNDTANGLNNPGMIFGKHIILK